MKKSQSINTNQNVCRYHHNVYKEMVGSFECMNDALLYGKKFPLRNGEIYTHDGHLLKEDFECECNGTGKINKIKE